MNIVITSSGPTNCIAKPNPNPKPNPHRYILLIVTSNK